MSLSDDDSMSFSPSKLVLDYTLRDLYSLDEDSDQDVVLIHALPDAKIQLSSSLPLSSKFAYQNPFSKTEDRERIAKFMLSAVPQNHGCIAGKMPVIMFSLNESATVADGGSRPVYQTNAFQTFAQMEHTPDLCFISGPQDIDLRPGAKISVAHPMDCLLHLPHTVDPETHY